MFILNRSFFSNVHSHSNRTKNICKATAIAALIKQYFHIDLIKTLQAQKSSLNGESL